tara:strand:- start:319 stop:1104 length:786 start_codon:yes stop_codon:yes gene_type:complete
MQLSEELKTLIDASLADGKISSKERQVLTSRAESDGLNKDEFELYLDSLAHSTKKDAKGMVDKSMPFFKWLVAKKRRVAIAAFILLGILQVIFEMISGVAQNSENAQKLEERGCANLEDCITKYKFEEARNYYDEKYNFNEDKLRKIVSSEVSYYVSQGALEMALRSVNEYDFFHGFEPQGRSDENTYYNEEVNWYNTMIEKTLVDFEEDKVNLKKLIYSIKPLAKIGKIFKKSEKNEYQDKYTYDKDNSKKEELLKRYRL